MKLDHLTQEQRDAIWKWKWLGWRGSTPAFRVCIGVLLGIALMILAFLTLV